MLLEWTLLDVGTMQAKCAWCELHQLATDFCEKLQIDVVHWRHTHLKNILHNAVYIQYSHEM